MVDDGTGIVFCFGMYQWVPAILHHYDPDVCCGALASDTNKKKESLFAFTLLVSLGCHWADDPFFYHYEEYPFRNETG